MQTADNSKELFKAIEEQKTLDVWNLLKEGCDPNSRMSDEACTTALIYAVKSHELRSVELLLKAKVNVDAQDELGRTASMYAAYNGHLDILKVLAKSGADLSLVDKDGANALMLTTQWGRCECLQYLLNKSKMRAFDINRQDNNGCTALMYAARHGSHECVRRLVDAKANINTVDFDEGYTALMHALILGELECASLLLQRRDADVNILSKDNKKTALSIALQGSLLGDFTIVEELLQRGANMKTSKVCQGYLHEMVARDQKKIVRLMVINGCPPTDKRCYQPCFKFKFSEVPISPIAVALLSGYPETARYFIANQFFTSYDLTKLPNDLELAKKINEAAGERAQVLALLDHLCSIPLSLKTLGLGTLLEMLNSVEDVPGGPDRKERIEQLELPADLKNKLLFAGNEKAVRMCILHWRDFPLAGNLYFEVCLCSNCKSIGGGFKVRM